MFRPEVNAAVRKISTASLILLLLVLAKTTTDSGFRSGFNIVPANAAERHFMESSSTESAIQSAADDDFIKVPFDTVPNLAKPYTVINVRSGNWDDPDTWQDRHIPGDDDIVRIAPGTRVVYGTDSQARLEAIGIAGELSFQTDRDTHLNVTHILVYPGGQLQIGSAHNPVNPEYTAEIVFTDSPLQTGTVGSPGRDPEQYGNGLLVWGTLTLHGAVKTPFVRTKKEPKKGDTYVILTTVPEHWKAGDTLLIPDSRQLADTDLEKIDSPPYNHDRSQGVVHDAHWETASIKRIEGSRILLEEPLRYDHPGAKNAQGALVSTGGTRLLPHAANLTRNIILRSERPTGVRGHTQYFRGASIDIAYSQFTDLGRTTIRELDSTGINGRNTVVKIGTNQIARYPLHLHRTIDPRAISEEDHEFRVIGNVINGGKRWGIVVHGSHFGLIEDNVVFDIDGAGIVTEDGTETGNIFENNFVSGIRGSGLPMDFRDMDQGHGHEGSGFWIGSDNNKFIDNVVASVRGSGFAFFRPEGAWSIPRFPRIKTLFRAEMSPERKPRIFAASGNEVYGSVGSGMTLWSTKYCKLCRLHSVTIDDTTIWHSRVGVDFDYHADFYEIDGTSIFGDPGELDDTIGIYTNNSRRAIIRNTTILNVDIGIEGGGSRNRRLVIDNTEITARVGIRILRSTSWGGMQPLIVRNPLFGYPHRADTYKNGHWIEFGKSSYSGRSPKVTQHRPVLIYNLQRQQGVDFELFEHGQAPGAIVPYNEDAAMGCPESGLTNDQCWNRYGIAYGGAVATCETTHPHIYALTCPMEPH